MLAAAILLTLFGFLSNSLLQRFDGEFGTATAYLVIGLVGAAILLLPAVVLISAEKCELVAPLHSAGERGYFVAIAFAAAALVVLISTVQSMLTGAAGGDRPLFGIAGVSVETADLFTVYIAFSLLPALCEELLFRRAVLGKLLQSFSAGWAVVLSAALFALLHGSLENLIAPFVIGLLLGYVVVISGKLWPALLVHVVSNTYSFYFELLLYLRGAETGRVLFFLFNIALLLVSIYVTLGYLQRSYRTLTLPRYENRLPLGAALRQSRESAIGLFLLLGLYIVRAVLIQ